MTIKPADKTAFSYAGYLNIDTTRVFMDITNNKQDGAIKAGYKQTEVGVIPEDWEFYEIQKIAKTGSGTTPPRENYNRYFNNGVNNWVKTTDLNNSLIFKTEEKVTTYALKETCLQMYPESTVLVAMYGGFNQIGRTGILKNPAAVNQALVAIQIDQKKFDPHYLLDFLNYNVKYWKSVASSSRKDPNITSNDVKKFKLVVPPTKTEQTSIAKALSDTDVLIQSLSQLIAKKRQIKQGAMQQLLNSYDECGELKAGWGVKNLGELAHVEMGQSPSSINYNHKGNGLPLLQGNADIKNRKTIIRAFTSEITKKCKANDIIMSVRAPVGEIAIAVFDACIGRGVCAIRYENEYLYHYLVYVESSWSKLSTGSTFDSVNSTEVKGLNIGIPENKIEQTQIANILTNMDTEITTLETKRTKYQQIKQGMMQNLLTGRIRLI